MIRWRIALLSCLTLALAAATAFGGPTRYHFQYIPGMQGASAFGINDVGQVVGAGDFDVPNYSRPFLYDSRTSVLKDLAEDVDGSGSAIDINNFGETVGTLFAEDRLLGFLYDGQEVSLLNATNETELRPIAINDNGDFVGTVNTGDGLGRKGFVQRDSGREIVGTLGGELISVRGINNAGVVAGHSTIAGRSVFHPFKYENGVLVDLLDTSNLGVEGSSTDINEAGDVVGDYSIGGAPQRAALFHGGDVHLLGALAQPGVADRSSASAINDRGEIVGYAFIDDSRSHGFIYDDDVMYDLNHYVDNLGDFVISSANDINNKGQIVGNANSPTLGRRAYILTPIPEPTTFALTAITALLTALAAKAAGRAGG